jgi:hypothetical protein
MSDASLTAAQHFRRTFSPVLLLVSVLCLVARVHAQPPELPKKTGDGKAVPAGLPIVKLPDGTFLWSSAAGDAGAERVVMTLQDFQKIQDQLDQIKKASVAAKPAAPSGCALKGRIENQGEQKVAAITAAYTFRTTAPLSLIALGGRKGFLVSALLDGKTHPILMTTDEGFAALIETPGEHTLALELFTPVTNRGASPKTELGFELGLPRAAITTLVLESPRPDLKVVNVTTRTADAGTPGRPAEPRRTSIELKQLHGKTGYALGPIESLEVSWDPPLARSQPVDQIQSAEVSVSVLVTESVVETTARFNLRGANRDWKIVAPASAVVSLERIGSSEVAPSQPIAVAKPSDPSKPVWKVELPIGSNAADWQVIAVMRQNRARPEDAKHRGPFAVGPFSVLEVLRQTVNVKVTAGPNVRFTFKHGPDLRQIPVPGPIDDDVTAANFRQTSWPTGSLSANPSPLLTFEAAPQASSVVVKPSYKLTLEKVPHGQDVWQIRAEIRVFPNHTTVDALTIDIPSEWPLGAEASLPAALPTDSTPRVPLGAQPQGFWAVVGTRATRGGRVPTTFRLPDGKKQPFDVVLNAIVRMPQGRNEVSIPLLRFPNVYERDASVTVTVPEGQEITRHEARGWEGEVSAEWVIPLAPVAGTSGKAAKAVTSVKGSSETGLSRVLLECNPAPLDIVVDVLADAVIGDKQMQITEQLKLKSGDGLPRAVRLRPSRPGVVVADLRAGVSPRQAGQYQVVNPVTGEGLLTFAADVREANVTISYAIGLSPHQSDDALAKVPVELFYAESSLRTEATVRVWMNTSAVHIISQHSPRWRERFPEPAPERDTLPSLTLSASAADVPLELELRESTEHSAAAVWVDRGLIQAWGLEDGGTRYRALFLLRKWQCPVLDVQIPAAASGFAPEFLLDGKKFQLESSALREGAAGDRIYHIPLDVSRGKSAVLEILYQTAQNRGDFGDDRFLPPVLANTAFTGPIRWYVTAPAGTTPILSSGAVAEFHWRWKSTGLAPSSTRSAKELEKWFQAGDEPYVSDELLNSPGESVSARQLALAPITIHRLPRAGFVIFCSVAAFLLYVGLSRMTLTLVGGGVAAAACIIGVTAMIQPHLCAQVVGACQPGVAAAVVLLLASAAVRSYYRHRLANLPSFSRTPIEPSGGAPVLSSSARNRPSGLGSASAVPMAPAGG